MKRNFIIVSILLACNAQVYGIKTRVSNEAINKLVITDKIAAEGWKYNINNKTDSEIKGFIRLEAKGGVQAPIKLAPKTHIEFYTLRGKDYDFNTAVFGGEISSISSDEAMAAAFTPLIIATAGGALGTGYLMNLASQAGKAAGFPPTATNISTSNISRINELNHLITSAELTLDNASKAAKDMATIAAQGGHRYTTQVWSSAIDDFIPHTFYVEVGNPEGYLATIDDMARLIGEAKTELVSLRAAEETAKQAGKAGGLSTEAIVGGAVTAALAVTAATLAGVWGSEVCATEATIFHTRGRETTKYTFYFNPPATLPGAIRCGNLDLDFETNLDGDLILKLNGKEIAGNSIKRENA